MGWAHGPLYKRILSLSQLPLQPAGVLGALFAPQPCQCCHGPLRDGNQYLLSWSDFAFLCLLINSSLFWYVY